MDRQMLASAGRVGREAAGICLCAAVTVGVMGYIQQWNTAMEFSNAFFIAGSLVIIAGASSRLAAGASWDTHQRFHAESMKEQGLGEQINSMVSASSPWRLVILGVASGVALMMVSVLITLMPCETLRPR